MPPVVARSQPYQCGKPFHRYCLESWLRADPSTKIVSLAPANQRLTHSSRSTRCLAPALFVRTHSLWTLPKCRVRSPHRRCCRRGGGACCQLRDPQCPGRLPRETWTSWIYGCGVPPAYLAASSTLTTASVGNSMMCSPRRFSVSDTWGSSLRNRGSLAWLRQLRSGCTQRYRSLLLDEQLPLVWRFVSERAKFLGRSAASRVSRGYLPCDRVLEAGRRHFVKNRPRCGVSIHTAHRITTAVLVVMANRGSACVNGVPKKSNCTRQKSVLVLRNITRQ